RGIRSRPRARLAAAAHRPSHSESRLDHPGGPLMSRTLNVVRLQLINKQTFIWVPLIVLAAATLVSVLIYAMIPSDGPKYGGGGQAPLWVFFAVGLSAMTMTFPFS